MQTAMVPVFDHQRSVRSTAKAMVRRGHLAACAALTCAFLCNSCGFVPSHYDRLCAQVEEIGVETIFADAYALIESTRGRKLPPRCDYHLISNVTNSLAVFGAAEVRGDRVTFVTGGMGSARMGLTIVILEGGADIPAGSKIYYWSMRNTGEGRATKNIYPKPAQ